MIISEDFMEDDLDEQTLYSIEERRTACWNSEYEEIEKSERI